MTENSVATRTLGVALAGGCAAGNARTVEEGPVSRVEGAGVAGGPLIARDPVPPELESPKAKGLVGSAVGRPSDGAGARAEGAVDCGAGVLVRNLAVGECVHQGIGRGGRAVGTTASGFGEAYGVVVGDLSVVVPDAQWRAHVNGIDFDSEVDGGLYALTTDRGTALVAGTGGDGVLAGASGFDYPVDSGGIGVAHSSMCDSARLEQAVGSGAVRLIPGADGYAAVVRDSEGGGFELAVLATGSGAQGDRREIVPLDQ